MGTIYIDFRIFSDIENISFDDLIFLPSESNKIGDKSVTGCTILYSEWNCTSKKMDCNNIDEVFKNFLKEIENNFDKIKERIQKSKAYVDICFVVRPSPFDTLELDLSNESIKKMAELNAGFEIDGI